MPIDFQKAAKAAELDLNNTKLGAVLLGPQSGGKSGALGTLGVKTLYLYFEGESHGPVSVTSHATSPVVPYCVTRDDDNNVLTADQAYKRLLEVLNDKSAIKAAGFGAVAVDGLTEMEVLIQSTQTWQSRVEKEKKGATAYSGDITISMFRPVMDALRSLQRELGMHFVVTGILDVQKYEDDGTILDGSPKLKGYDVALGLILQFPDRLVIGHMCDPKTKEEVGPRLQMSATCHRTTADQITKKIRKVFNFRVQLGGCDMTKFPDSLRPDLSRLVKYKEARKYFKADETK